MVSYEVLDAIADAYTPLLFIGYLVFSILYWRKGDRLAVVKGFAGIIVAYGFMFADNAWQFWPSVGLDYSTHSAVALALIAFHIHKRPLKSPSAISFTISLALYYALEVYQQYHSILDIVTTAAVVGPAIALTYWALSKLPLTPSPKPI